MKAYSKTETGIERRRAAVSNWITRNPEKRKAQVAVGNAIRDGRLTRGTCEKCGSPKVHAHHDDYTKPLEVRWLCPQHHSDHHREE
jgi:ribosomal protein S27AE